MYSGQFYIVKDSSRIKWQDTSWTLSNIRHWEYAFKKSAEVHVSAPQLCKHLESIPSHILWSVKQGTTSYWVGRNNPNQNRSVSQLAYQLENNNQQQSNCAVLRKPLQKNGISAFFNGMKYNRPRWPRAIPLTWCVALVYNPCICCNSSARLVKISVDVTSHRITQNF